VAANIVSSEHCVLAHAEAPGVGGVGGSSIVFSVSGPNAQDSTARTTDFDGAASFCYTGTQNGTDTITAFADSDGSGTRQTTEPQDTATKHWLATQPQISLSPPSASNPINTRHTVTATVSDGTGPVAGANVFFSATGTGQFFACDEDFDDADGFVRTNASGEASCTYTSEIAGLDTITAVADTTTTTSRTTAKAAPPRQRGGPPRASRSRRASRPASSAPGTA
jgi:hypothetical protein